MPSINFDIHPGNLLHSFTGLPSWEQAVILAVIMLAVASATCFFGFRSYYRKQMRDKDSRIEGLREARDSVAQSKDSTIESLRQTISSLEVRNAELARISQLSGLPISVSQSSAKVENVSAGWAPLWEPLTNEQTAILLSSWRLNLSGKELQITHNGMSDAAKLATELAAILQQSGAKLIGPPSVDIEDVQPGFWICAPGGNTDEIGAPLAIALRQAGVCRPDIVAPIGYWVRIRIGQKSKRQ